MKLFKYLNYIMEENTNKWLSSLYNLSYFDKYGGSLIFTFIVAIIVLLFIGYVRVKSNLRSLQKDWSSIRCSPQYLPFAGLISPEKLNDVSSFEEAEKNFAYCSGMILKTVSDDSTRPIKYVIKLLHEIVTGLSNDVNMIRKKFSDIIGNLEHFADSIMGRILNGTLPITYMIIKLKDTLAKSVGIMVTNVYGAEIVIKSFKAFITAFINLTIEGLIALVAAIIPLIALIVTAPLAAPLLVAFGVVSVFLMSTINTLTKPLGLKVVGTPPTKPKPPPPPNPFKGLKNLFCFGPNTELELIDDSKVLMKDIKPGMLLKYDGQITSVLKVEYNSKTCGPLYDIGGILVSGSHSKYVGFEWKYVEECGYPKILSISGRNPKYIYCINTMSKKIHIEDKDGTTHVFSDWDDVEDTEHLKICEKMNMGNTFTQSDYHKNLENGLSGKIFVRYPNGLLKDIQNVKIGDILEGDNKVLGKATILGDVPLYHYKFGMGTKELCIRNKYYEKDENDENVNIKEKELYHLETDKGFFKLYDDSVIMNYRYGIERLL